MRKIKILKLLTVITNILTIVCLILVLTLKTQFFYSLYWALIPLLLMFVMLLIREIDKGNLDTDISKSKGIKRAYNDSTAIAIVFYGMVYLIILFFEQLSSKVYNNIYVIIGFPIHSMHTKLKLTSFFIKKYDFFINHLFSIQFVIMLVNIIYLSI